MEADKCFGDVDDGSRSPVNDPADIGRSDIVDGVTISNANDNCAPHVNDSVPVNDENCSSHLDDKTVYNDQHCTSHQDGKEAPVYNNKNNTSLLDDNASMDNDKTCFSHLDDKAPDDHEVIVTVSEEDCTTHATDGNSTDTDGGNPFDRNRPYSASVISRDSRRSVSSRTSRSASICVTDISAKTFFSFRSHEDGVFKNVRAEVLSRVLKTDIDGEVIGVWLLTEIDHWDNEREKMIILIEKSLLVIQYDFIRRKILQTKRIALSEIDVIQLGDVKYPPKSLMTPRNHGGLKLSWSKGTNSSQPTFGQRWNPWCRDLPFVIFAHHHLLYYPREQETATFSMEDFYEGLVPAVRVARGASAPSLKIIEEPIVVEAYANLWSMIYNQSRLGFNKERGGISY